MLLALLLVTLAGLGALWFGVNHAVQGYEDESGFHEGIAPKPLEATLTTQTAVFGTWNDEPSATRSKRRTHKSREMEDASLSLF